MQDCIADLSEEYNQENLRVNILTKKWHGEACIGNLKMENNRTAKLRGKRAMLCEKCEREQKV